MQATAFTSKPLARFAVKYLVCNRNARLSRPSLAHARLCLRFTRTIATAMILLRTSMCSALRAGLRPFNIVPDNIVAPAWRTPARALNEDPRSLMQYPG